MVRVRERGPGIEDLQAILDGRVRLADRAGARDPRRPAADGPVRDRRRARGRGHGHDGEGPAQAVGRPLARRTWRGSPPSSRRHAPQGLLDELQQQNQELIRTLQELRDRQAEVTELHRRELEETNRGVVALYAELDENAKALRRISELKSRFLSNMSHEFRSPLNTILSLSGFLLDRSDGDLTPEQEKQVAFIRKAAEGLSALVNDLLDLAKVEAGKAVVRPEVVRGRRPLRRPARARSGRCSRRAPVSLRLRGARRACPRSAPTRASSAQILRNFLSNAVKFTERGRDPRRRRRRARATRSSSRWPTPGSGSPRRTATRIFEEFGQVEGPVAEAGQGDRAWACRCRASWPSCWAASVSVRSEPGVGSTFFAVIPRVYQEPATSRPPARVDRWQLDPGRSPVLVVEDDPVDLLLYEKILEGSGFQVLPARTLDEARRILRRVRPAAVLLDILLEAESGWTLLTEMKAQEATRDIPSWC